MKFLRQHLPSCCIYCTDTLAARGWAAVAAEREVAPWKEDIR